MVVGNAVAVVVTAWLAPGEMVSFLSSLGPHVDFVPNAGNAGDALINVGCMDALERAGVEFTYWSQSQVETAPLGGRTVVMAGGGGLVPPYDTTARFLSILKERAGRLVVLPQTVVGHEALLAGLGPSVTFFGRERPTLEHLAKSAVGGAQVLGADDMAFHADIGRLLGFRVSDHGASIERLRMWAEPRLLSVVAGDRLSAFRLDAERTSVHVPHLNRDLSSLAFCGMENPGRCRLTSAYFVRYLDCFRTIETNRLHVGIASARLGKRVLLHGNSFFKVGAVYEASLAGPDVDVTYVPAPER